MAAVIDPGKSPPINRSWAGDESFRAARINAALDINNPETIAAFVVLVQETGHSPEVSLHGAVPPELWPAIAETLRRVVEEAHVSG